MSGTVKTIRASQVQAGDIAHHKGGLDSRVVTRVEGRMIGLQIGTVEAWPCPRANYTFTRRIVTSGGAS